MRSSAALDVLKTIFDQADDTAVAAGGVNLQVTVGTLHVVINHPVRPAAENTARPRPRRRKPAPTEL